MATAIFISALFIADAITPLSHEGYALIATVVILTGVYDFATLVTRSE